MNGFGAKQLKPTYNCTPISNSITLCCYQENDTRITFQKEDTELVITSEKKLFLKRFEKTIKVGQISEDIVGIAAGFNRVLLHNLLRFERLTRRGVKIRVITTKS